ncbi:hypothetical protein MCEREM30_00688 [Paracoccaceae bacterium]
MKRKLDDEEYQALLNAFDGQKFSFRKTSSQSMPFRVSFYFMNIYAISMMLVYYIVANYLLDYINPQFLEHHYLDLLERRAFIFLWLLGAFNMAFYFGVGFRVVAGVILLYSINATFSQIIVIHSNFGFFNFAETPIFSAYALSRPLFMIATVGALIFYKDT